MPDNVLHEFLFRRMDGIISLKKALDAYSLRHKVISSNVANSETPEYQAQKVDFEEDLKKALDRQSRGLSRTHDNHMPVRGGLRQLDKVRGEVNEDETPEKFNGINNVDVEKQMAQMATNQIHFSAASKVLGLRYRKMIGAIRGQM